MPSVLNNMQKPLQLESKHVHRSLFLFVVACHGAPPAAPSVKAPRVTPTSASAGQPAADLGPLPPQAAMGARGVVGSRLVTFKAAQDAHCTESADATDSEKLGAACTQATKMHHVLGPVRLSVEDSGRHEETKVRMTKGHCYRLYVGRAAEVVSLAVTLRDSKGDAILDENGVAMPRDGVLCASETDEVTAQVAAGQGRGKVTLSVWSDER